MDKLTTWAVHWNVPAGALQELRAMMGIMPDAPEGRPGRSEANVQSRVRLEAARKGLHLWRNNNGACVDENGNHIRYGLANDSKKLNEFIKSSDLIGIRSVEIQPHHVGQVIGQFVAREVKPEGWVYSGTDREVAQRRFIELVTLHGGDARFCNEEGTL